MQETESLFCLGRDYVQGEIRERCRDAGQNGGGGNRIFSMRHRRRAPRERELAREAAAAKEANECMN